MWRSPGSPTSTGHVPLVAARSAPRPQRRGRVGERHEPAAAARAGPCGSSRTCGAAPARGRRRATAWCWRSRRSRARAPAPHRLGRDLDRPLAAPPTSARRARAAAASLLAPRRARPRARDAAPEPSPARAPAPRARAPWPPPRRGGARRRRSARRPARGPSAARATSRRPRGGSAPTRRGGVAPALDAGTVSHRPRVVGAALAVAARVDAAEGEAPQVLHRRAAVGPQQVALVEHGVRDRAQGSGTRPSALAQERVDRGLPA